MNRACLLLAFASFSVGQCPSACSSHGSCAASGVCTCFDGWRGASCAERACPRAAAWVSYGAGGTDDVHSVEAECSGVGSCDAVRGLCACQSGFSGAACQTLACPSTGSLVCSNHGRCVTLSTAAALGSTSSTALPFAASTYAGWDATRVMGCVCDNDWTGADCSTPRCTSGDDPLTPGVPRVVGVQCSCPSGGCLGAFRVTLGGRSALIRANAIASAEFEDSRAASDSIYATGNSIESTLRTIAPSSIMGVSVSSGQSVCGANSLLQITFLNALGNSPLTRLDLDVGTLVDGGGGTVSLTSTLISSATTESVPCSNRGTCVNGECRCFSGFFSSDGNGGPGGRPDCGSQKESVSSAVSVVTACPLGCSGRGFCDSTHRICRCPDGFSGGACEVKACPMGRAWFDQPSPDGTAHRPAQCSNRGLCSGSGVCTCFPGFTGATPPRWHHLRFQSVVTKHSKPSSSAFSFSSQDLRVTVSRVRQMEQRFAAVAVRASHSDSSFLLRLAGECHSVRQSLPSRLFRAHLMPER